MAECYTKWARKLCTEGSMTGWMDDYTEASCTSACEADKHCKAFALNDYDKCKLFSSCYPLEYCSYCDIYFKRPHTECQKSTTEATVETTLGFIETSIGSTQTTMGESENSVRSTETNIGTTIRSTEKSVGFTETTTRTTIRSTETSVGSTEVGTAIRSTEASVESTAASVGFTETTIGPTETTLGPAETIQLEDTPSNKGNTMNLPIHTVTETGKYNQGNKETCKFLSV